jgi:hypothetical protein
MAKNPLQEFFHQKKQKTKAASGDWAAKRDAWIKAVKDLYKTIADDYLKAVKADVEITYPEKVVTEDSIGEYRIPELNLRVGDEVVVFSPKGVHVVGARGRIDVQGDRGDATIIWQGGDQWSFVAARVPTPKLVVLSAESLAEILKGIMRP